MITTNVRLDMFYFFIVTSLRAGCNVNNRHCEEERDEAILKRWR
jgi:hypothetical protein